MDMKKVNYRPWGPAVPVLRLKTNRSIILALMFALSLALFPAEAYPDDCNVTGDIPFTVSNDAVELCILCSGPWARTSKLVKLSAGEHNCKFYAADKTILSLYGEWGCNVYTIGSDGNCNSINPIIANQEYCLEKTSPLPEFDIYISDGSIELYSNLNTPGPFCSTSVSAFLGDNPGHSKSRPDTDVFLFTGNAGDELTLTLEADTKGGNNSGEASFGLTGNSLNEATNGNLPLKINAMLPADGVYSISIEQPRNPGGLRYRGGYDLIVDSQAGVDLIEPTSNVEK